MQGHHHDHHPQNHSHQHSSHPEKRYHVAFTTTPTPIQANQTVRLAFRPQLEGHPHEKVALQVTHEMDMHLLIVSRDLSYFEHLHPVADGEGNYLVEHVFPKAGSYILFEDFAPQGEAFQVERQEISVSGETPVTAAPLGQTLSWQGDGYQLRIAPQDLPVQVNTPVVMHVEVQREGRPVTDLSDYLGALAHVVIISEDTTQYLHVHPLSSEEKDPEIVFHTQFPKSGIYKVFLQFNHYEKIHTAAFVLHVP